MKVRPHSRFLFRTLICIATLVQTASFAHAQHSCGIASPSDLQWEVAQRIAAMEPSHERNGIKTYLIKVHIIRNDQGIPDIGHDFPTILNAIEGCNDFFQQTDLRFRVCGGPTYTDNTALQQINTISPLFANFTLQNDQPGFINLYVKNNILSGGFAAYAYFPGRFNQIVGGFFDPFIMAHELGHLFGLQHTFGPSTGFLTTELADGSNCSTAADLICDTPADPYPFAQVNQNCQYNSNLVDANGDFYNPATDNIMSYNPPTCSDKFTTGQDAFMENVADAERFYYRHNSLAASISGFPTALCAGDTNNYVLEGIPAGGSFSGAGLTGNVLNVSNLSAGTYTISYTPAATAADTLLESDAMQSAYSKIYESNNMWQGFQALGTGDLTRITTRFSKEFPGLIELNIYAGIGTSGNLLHSEQWPFASSNSEDWRKFNLSNAVPLVANQLYTFEMTSLLGDVKWSCVKANEASSLQENANITSSPQADFFTYVTSVEKQQEACGGSLTFAYQVQQPINPAINLTLRSTFCEDEAPVELSNTIGITIDSTKVNGVADAFFDVEANGTGQHQIDFHYRDLRGCRYLQSKTVDVRPYPDAGIPDALCINEAPISLLNAYPGGSYWLNGNPINSIDPQALGTGTYQLSMHLPNVIDTPSLSVANAGPTVASSGSGFNSPQTTYAQSFTAEQSGLLNNFTVRLWLFAGQPIIKAEIRKGEGFSGQLLYSATETINTMGIVNHSYMPANFSGNIPLEEDSIYSIVVTRMDANPSSNISWVRHFGYNYPHGKAFDANGVMPNTDFFFEVWAKLPFTCGEDQTQQLLISDAPPLVDLGSDTLACDSLTLDAGIAPFYNWSDGSNTQTNTVHQSGTYWVEVSNGCTDADSISVTISSPNTGSIVGPWLVYTGFQNEFSVANTAGSSYLWDAGQGTIHSGQGSDLVVVSWPDPAPAQLQVTETNADLCTGVPAIHEVNVVGAIGQEELTTKAAHIYPNPSRGLLIIELPQNSTYHRYQLRDLLGNTLESGLLQAPKTILQTERLPSGTYLLGLLGDNKHSWERIVLQK